ncbi:hypothetical protein CNMCM5878_005661 [Aspergillus fumigatiaffinis]|nr:hypothetical protein CNMCM5878_005661 [Aspergillus fumigatiaffinis]
MDRVAPRLSQAELLFQFDRHRDRANRIPTALVSVSDRHIEALHCGLEKYYNLSEDPGLIWIAIIFVPDTDATKKSTGYRHAKKLNRWRTWRTLTSSNAARPRLDLCDYLDDTDHLPDLKTLRKEMTERLLNPSFSGYDIGRSLHEWRDVSGRGAPCLPRPFFGYVAASRPLFYPILQQDPRFPSIFDFPLFNDEASAILENDRTEDLQPQVAAPSQTSSGMLAPYETDPTKRGDIAGLEGSEDNPILINLDDVSLSEEETEICTSPENFDGSLENPIWILDEGTVCESPGSQTEDNAAVQCPDSSLLDPVCTPKGNMEDPQSESGCVVGMECPLVQMQGSITATFDSPELPVYYFKESRLCESPESDWQGTTHVGSPHISTVNSTCIPEGSMEAEPQRDHGIVMDSVLPQTEGAARATPRSSDLLIREPEVPALVDGSRGFEPTLSEDHHDADEWLANLDNNATEEGPHDPQTTGSVPTSMATNTRTAQGNIYKACHCPGHQEIYSNWPTRDAELRIAHCMRICMYCGKDFAVAAELRRHIKRRKEYSWRNLIAAQNPSLPEPLANPSTNESSSEPISHRQSRCNNHPPMLRHQELRILQYNVRKSRDVVLASLFRNPRILDYDILAIQEPWRNPFIETSYHPLKAHFQLAYLADPATRVCLYISKRIDPSTWSVSYVSKDIIRLRIVNPHASRMVNIFNVYNEVATDMLSTLAEAIGASDPHEETMVLGDFNLHHPLWSTTHRRAARDPTYRWKDGESTIDLAFASEDLANHAIHCKIDRKLDCDSDHLPISLVFDWGWQPANPTRKRLWTKTNVEILRRTAEAHLPRTSSTLELRDKDSIDKFISSIISALDAGIEASTPWLNPSPRSIAGFDQECKDLCTQVQQLRRTWQQSRQDEDYEAYRQARNRKGRLIQKMLRNTHRQRVEEASASQTGLWNLVKWARNRHNTTPAFTPALVKPDGGTAHQPEEKAEVLQ